MVYVPVAMPPGGGGREFHVCRTIPWHSLVGQDLESVEIAFVQSSGRCLRMIMVTILPSLWFETQIAPDVKIWGLDGDWGGGDVPFFSLRM